MNAVIFDVGGVIIPWVPQRAYEQVMPADEVPAFMERIGFDVWNRANDALPSIVESQNELARRFPDDALGIQAYWRHFELTISSMIPGTSGIIAELQRDGVTIGGLTNWAAEPFAVAQRRFGILNRFRDIVISGVEGIVKPDPAIYRLACQRLGVMPEQAVFVDDTAANAIAASEVGLTGLHFTSAERLRADLVELGLLGPRLTITEPIYHWALRTEWDAAMTDGYYPWSTRGVDYLAEGFVHGSFGHQVKGIRQEIYGDLADADLALLRVDPTPDLPVVVENGYPHLFAPLPLDASQVNPTTIGY
ncbi:MAG: HAD-IA family hydrolase [Propionibacteriaceae bacterium]|nr:HAD-IA family hydrolase [Propionibacteriaceae bacterium]